MEEKITLKDIHHNTRANSLTKLRNVRLYDAIMAIIYKKGEATFNEIIRELEKLKTRNILSYSREEVATVLVLAATMKVLKNGDGSFKLRLQPRGEYKLLLEQLSELLDVNNLNGDSGL